MFYPSMIVTIALIIACIRTPHSPKHGYILNIFTGRNSTRCNLEYAQTFLLFPSQYPLSVDVASCFCSLSRYYAFFQLAMSIARYEAANGVGGISAILAVV